MTIILFWIGGFCLIPSKKELQYLLLPEQLKWKYMQFSDCEKVKGQGYSK